MADREKFTTAVELLGMLEEVVRKNPDTLIMASTDNGSGYLVIDTINPELDSDGDARFEIRDWDCWKE